MLIYILLFFWIILLRIVAHTNYTLPGIPLYQLDNRPWFHVAQFNLV
jgi:hypothetical protein